MAGIMDMFRTAMTGAPAAGQPDPNKMPQPGNIPPGAAPAVTTAAGEGTAANGAIPAGTKEIAAASPLDAFNELWNNPAKPAGDNGSYFNVDLDALNKAAQQQDFTGGITPEHLAAISKGGDDAMKAFADAMNAVSRDVYARSALAATKIVDTALGKSETKMRGEVPNIVKKHTISDTLRSENPAFTHPAAQPVIEALEKQLIMKYPQASATELRSLATTYLSSFAAIMTPPAGAGNQTGGGTGKPAEMDWSTFL